MRSRCSALRLCCLLRLAAGADDAPRTALLVVGAAYDVREDVLQRYFTHVIEPYGAGSTRTFALVKAVHFNGRSYDNADTAALAATVQRILRPTDSLVTNTDPTVRRFGNASQDAVDCLYPRSGFGRFSTGLTQPPVGGYDQADSIEVCRKRFVYWWGAMQLATRRAKRRFSSRSSSFASAWT
ncbi:hypothetical protein M885DRAFT_508240 [Pelagophyceae sp. CCMP2097]|nr:hypothetical protein M885DRAFT_508240 [Pelagophyceae sp. CCMP2097]